MVEGDDEWCKVMRSVVKYDVCKVMAGDER